MSKPKWETHMVASGEVTAEKFAESSTQEISANNGGWGMTIKICDTQEPQIESKWFAE